MKFDARKVICTMFMVGLGINILNAQTDFVIHWPLSGPDLRSLWTINHITDAAGNIYVLSTMAYFDPNGPSTEGEYTYGSVVTKVDPQGAVAWQQLYPIAAGPHGLTAGLLPAAQLFKSNDTIFIPFNMNYGYAKCDSFSYKATARNGALRVDARTGAVLMQTVFEEDTVCTRYRLYFTSVHPDKTCSYLYTYSGYGYESYYNNDRNSDMTSFNTYKPAGVTAAEFDKIIYNTETDEYLVAGKTALRFCNHSWQQTRSFDLPPVANLDHYVGATMATNKNYHVVNIWNPVFAHPHISQTIVYDDAGAIISSQPSPIFKSLAISKDNRVFGISYPDNFNNIAADTAAVFTEMDLFQNIQRRKMIGKPFVGVVKISVTDGNEIIVSGTQNTTDKPCYPLSPAGLYVYREQLSNIPLLIRDSSLCDVVSIAPNPVNRTLNISSTDFNRTHNAAIKLIDAAGQSWQSATWVGQTWSADVSYLSAGVYFLRITNAHDSCLLKVVRQ